MQVYVIIVSRTGLIMISKNFPFVKSEKTNVLADDWKTSIRLYTPTISQDKSLWNSESKAQPMMGAMIN